MYEELVNLMRARGYSEKTISNYLTALKAFEKFSGKTVKDASVDEIIAFLASLTPQSRYMYAIAIRSVLKLLGRQDYTVIKIPKSKPRRYVIIPEEDVAKICYELYSSKPKLAVAIALTYELALRLSELCNLRLSDLDLNTWTATVERVKSKRVYRLPIISDWVKQLLIKYVSTHPRHTDYLIYSQKKPYRYRVPVMSKLISGVLKEYGYDAKPHDLRHSRATNLLKRGLDVRALQIFLGHASIAQTERYTHLTEVDLRKMIETLYKQQVL